MESSSALAKRKERIAQASRERRKKNKFELESLRQSNSNLKEENEKLKAQMLQLESQVTNKISNSQAQTIFENGALKLELDLHKKFIHSFSKELGIPDELSGQRALCKQGAIAARAYAEALVADSHNGWRKLHFPKDCPNRKNVRIHGCLKDRLFPSISEPEERGRTGLRLDAYFPNKSAAEVIEAAWASFTLPETRKRILGFESGGFESKRIDSADKDTCLIHDQVSLPDKSKVTHDVAYICDKHVREIPRSCVRPPDRASPEWDNMYSGTVKSTLISMTSTMFVREVFRAYCVDKVGKLVSSVIVHAVEFWEDEGGTHLIFAGSNTDEFRWHNICRSDLVNGTDGIISTKLARLLDDLMARFDETIQPQT